MNFELVVARYNENLDWLSQVGHKYKITVYNKGDGQIGTRLLNVGREAETYLTHIINNYDNLADITVFCQGDPFDHDPNFLNNINHEIFKLIQYHSFFNFGKIYNKESKIVSHPGWKFGKLDINLYEFNKKLYRENYDYSYEINSFVEFVGGAQFFVNKNKILKHTKNFYMNAKTLVDYDSNPVEGHCFERTWHYIFS